MACVNYRMNQIDAMEQKQRQFVVQTWEGIVVEQISTNQQSISFLQAPQCNETEAGSIRAPYCNYLFLGDFRCF